MTGNVVFLAFAAAGAPGLTIASSLLAVLAFRGGGLTGGTWIHSGGGPGFYSPEPRWPKRSSWPRQLLAMNRALSDGR